MNNASQSSRARRYILIGVAAIAAVMVAALLWMVVLAPRAMDFAGGPHPALTEYHAQDPTGVPPELKDASLVERGAYLARAADCEACHTAEGGAPPSALMAIASACGAVTCRKDWSLMRTAGAPSHCPRQETSVMAMSRSLMAP